MSLVSWVRDALWTSPRADYKPWDDFWYERVAGVGTVVGIPVTPLVALQVSAVFACVKVISETLASLPLLTYERKAGGGKERAPDHYLYDLLHESPNAWQTAFEFIDDGQGWACLHGNAYAEIIPGTLGAVGELVPIRPELVTVEQLTSRRLRYTVREADGTPRVLTQDQVLHVRGRSLDSVHGLSTHVQARDAIALARAIEMYGAKFFANDASIGVMLEHPGTLTEKAHARLRETFSAKFGGVGNAHKPKILEEGMKASRLAMTAAREAQLTEAESAAVLNVCRYFRVPPHKVQHLLHATFSNIEHQSIEFVTDTILPWARRWETRINATLITDKKFFVEFLIDGLLRGDNEARGSYYTSLFNVGALSQNEIRARENLNPIAEGNRYFVQGALVPTDKVDQFVGGQPRGTAPAEDTPPPRAPARASAPVRAFQLLIADAADRLARAETREIAKRAEKAEADPDRFAAWLSMWYADHAAYVRRTLQPLADAWAAETGQLVDVGALASCVVGSRFDAVYDYAEAFPEWSAGRAAQVDAAIYAAFALGSADALPAPDMAALVDARVRALLPPPAATSGSGTTVLVEASGVIKQNLTKHVEVVYDANGAMTGIKVREVYEGSAAA